ncbi:MAG TPA: hypothetical protein VHM25_25255 [Polyangiaceae bacterium]|nr:hypothetical protein [Polyangiaceae bacterium]
MGLNRILVITGLTVSALGVSQCKSTIVKKSPIASGCELDSDCDSPLVCGFGRCHVECRTNADCDVGRCLISESGNICQLPQEVACTYTSECPSSLVCGVDGQCRNQCQAKRDCLPGQVCASTGECASPDEVDMSGSLKIPAAPGDGTGGTAGAPNPPGGASGISGGGMDNLGGVGTTGASKGGTGGDAGKGGVSAGGSGAAGGSAAAGSGGQWIGDAEVLRLTPSDGWIDANSNLLKIQGAVFGYADSTSTASLLTDFSGLHMCIKGTAAQVDMASDACVNKMFTPPATDCFGQYWGSAIGLNLNQPLDMTLDPPMGGTPLPYDASALKGFGFEVSGNTVPPPASIRFKVQDNQGKEYCNPATSKLKIGVNNFLFSELVTECWGPTINSLTAETGQSKLIMLVWQVVTNTSTTVPYDFCVSNLRALPK